MYVIINLKINNFRIMINQQPKFCAIFVSKINPDAHVSTKIHSHCKSGSQSNEMKAFPLR